jgi:hypothetical protein
VREKLEYQPWPSMCAWLPDELPSFQKAIVFRAHSEVGICENPPSSNRSGRIDEYNRRAGAPLGSYWCASWATAVWEDCGCLLPKEGRASTDVLRSWAINNGLWSMEPVYGALVIYGKGVDAEHVGIVGRLTPLLRSYEGNAGAAGAPTRNGEGVEFKVLNLAWKLGYIHPKLA